MRETLVETEVSYAVEFGGRFYIVEHVPARVCEETGEQYFSPETVDRIQAIIKSNRKPDRVLETPVYQYT